MAGFLGRSGPGVREFALTLGLLLTACGSPRDSDLFAPQQVMSGQGSAGHGGGSGGNLGAAGSGGTLSVAGSAGSAGHGSGGDGGGTSGNGGASGSGGGASGGTSGSSGAGGGSGSGGGGEEPNCDHVGGVGFAATGHCYVIHQDQLVWAEARDHCVEDGGYLATIGSEVENDFLWSLVSDRKWIGATDGRPPTQPAAGQYAWVTGEPLGYENWTPGQPNAAIQACPDMGPGPQPLVCYEHCAYQWDPDGDLNAGEWNDQGCWEIEVFVCEHE